MSETLPMKEEDIGPKNPKRRLFCYEYVVDKNATQAAIRAGYSPRTAKSQGQRLLTFDDVAALIDHLLQKHAQKLELTTERVLLEYCRLGFSNMADYMDITREEFVVETEEGEQTEVREVVKLKPFSEMSRDQLAAISEIHITEQGVVKYKLADKRGPLQDLAKHLNLFPDSHGQLDVNLRGAILHAEIEGESDVSYEEARRFAFFLTDQAMRKQGKNPALAKSKRG